jgi:hypothetical protein
MQNTLSKGVEKTHTVSIYMLHPAAHFLRVQRMNESCISFGPEVLPLLISSKSDTDDVPPKPERAKSRTPSTAENKQQDTNPHLLHRASSAMRVCNLTADHFLVQHTTPAAVTVTVVSHGLCIKAMRATLSDD